jgi:RIO kinase 1
MAARRSTHRRFDDEGWEPASAPPEPVRRPLVDDTSDQSDRSDEPSWSSYRDATRGPEPPPDWLVIDPRAIDVDHGVMKSGKEADVSLVERCAPPHDSGPRTLLAVKRYRSAEHRMFHRDAGYLEGRRVRRSREMRAMQTRTTFGRELIAGQWAAAEFAVLSRLWLAGAAVPYPVQLIGTELMMEFIGSPDGVAAPRLAQLRPDRRAANELFAQMQTVLLRLAEAGFAHGDLSPYNVLVDGDRLVLIDLPQAIDIVGNPQGFDYLRRDCDNICSWFDHQGAANADAGDLCDLLSSTVPGLGG